MPQPMITRSIRGTIVQLLCMRTVDGKLYKHLLFVPGRYSSIGSRKLRANVDALADLPAGDRIVKILDVEKVSRRYKMSEKRFIECAEQVCTENDENNENTENNERK